MQEDEERERENQRHTRGMREKERGKRHWHNAVRKSAAYPNSSNNLKTW